MRVKREIVCCALTLVMCLAPRAGAGQTTGSISGHVFDSSGEPVAGAQVQVSGAPLPGVRTAGTSDTGEYHFPLLLPGTYLVEASKQDLGTSSRQVVVEVDKDSQLDFALGLAVQEELTVTAVLPVVDVKSTEVNFNYSKELIETLPLGRSYSGLFQLMPGVADNNSFAPNAGGSRQDNTFLIDGVNITNPGFGYLATEVNEFDVVEFNVKRGAITAEFGRSSGVVTNAVTRSGTNRFSGGVRLEMVPRQWIADSKDPTIQNTTDRWIPTAAAGGPLVKDKVFWYGSGLFLRANTTERVNRSGPLPDSEYRVNEGFVKITAQPTAQHFFSGSFRGRPSERTNAGLGVTDHPSVATNDQGTNRVATVVWNWFVSDRTIVDARYLHMTEENESVAITALGFRPTFDPANLARMGAFFDPALNLTVGGAGLNLNRQNYKRDEVKVTLTQYLDFGGAAHQIKAGFGFDESQEDLTRKSNGWGSVALIERDTQVRGRYYPDQPSQISPARTYSLFVQDDVTIGDRLVVNAGLLLNRDEFAQKLQTRNTFLTFAFADEIQPRLGLNYNVRKGTGDKAYVNYGRYYNLDMKSSARSLAPNRLYTSDAIFDRATGRLLSDTPGANTTGKVLDPALDPPHIDEYLVGYATPLRGHWGLDVFFMFRDADDFIEDQPTVLPASSFIVANVPAAERRYRALTVEVSRRQADRWNMTASYSWSRLYGNFDLDFLSSGTGFSGAAFNTSSLLQDGPGVFVEDRLRQGSLNQDRPHVLKLFATYLPTDRITVGGYLRVQSGTAWAARGRDWYNSFNRLLEAAGSRRNDTWPNFDLLGAYRFPLGPRAGLKVEGRLLNVFDTQTALVRDQRQYLDGRIRAFSSPPPADCPACFTDLMIQGTTQPNPDFGRPTQYAPARQFLLTLLLDF